MIITNLIQLYISFIFIKAEINKKDFPYYIFLYERGIKENKFIKCKKLDCFKLKIHEDLSIFQGGLSKTNFNFQKDTKAFTHYQIVDGLVYRSRNCYFQPRCEMIDSMLTKISKDVPNTEFLVNLRDVSITHEKAPIPIFSYTRAKFYLDVSYPVWHFIGYGPIIENHYSRGIGDWDNEKIVMHEEYLKFPWDSKIDKVFFRGSRKIDYRDEAVKLTNKNSELYDVRYVKNQAWSSTKDSGGFEPVEEIHMKELCKYKYLLDLISYHASSRTRHLFLCGSVVFRSEPRFQEFWTFALKPWIHYIPIFENCTDIEEKVQFAIENPDIAKVIAENGRKLVYENLDMSVVFDYWKELLIEYSPLLTWKVKANPNYKNLKSQYNHLEL